ncbi:MAG: hypothetical protein AB8B39_00090, partial [Prochlorococcus sp.]
GGQDSSGIGAASTTLDFAAGEWDSARPALEDTIAMLKGYRPLDRVKASVQVDGKNSKQKKGCCGKSRGQQAFGR